MVVVLAAAPTAQLDAWVQTKTGSTRSLRFTDAQGEHSVKFEVKGTELFVTHTVGAKTIWKAKDFVEACEFDLTLEVVDGSIEVTDVDGDGTPEVSFLYRLGCRSDVSPLTAKLLFYEGSEKYALRGETRERVGETEYVGGSFKADPSFDKVPALRTFAVKKWKSLIGEAVP